MMRTAILLLLVSLAGVTTVVAQEVPASRATDFRRAVAPFIERYCVGCHGEKKPEAEMSLRKLPDDPRTPSDLATWKKVFEQLESNAMPPEDADQPSLAARLQAMEWIKRTLKVAGAPVDESRARASTRGNWVDHATLFSGKAAGDSATPDRVWRITDDAYDAFIKRLSTGGGRTLKDLTPPWQLPTQWSFSDYSTAHRVGEAEIEVHLRASSRIAKHITALFPKNKQFAPLDAVTKSGEAATPEQVQAAVKFAFAFLLGRKPDATLAAAVANEKLSSREEVRQQVARILTDDAIAKPRIVRFFRKYFGYDPAPEVFKDQGTQKAHGIADWEPTFFVTDADRLVEWILSNDKQVLRELLTTNQTFVRTYDERKPSKRASYFNRRFGKRPAETPIGEHGVRATLAIYEVELATRGDWSPDRPYDMPPEHRMGMLTHPAWLVAQSGNFDNHAIHRGRWIRERLLGGRIPDLPITVNAMLPDEPHHTLRERMRVVREEYCWTCHKQMDPLGLPFEQFDHFGRFRTTELVFDKEATEAKSNLGKDGQPRQKLYKQMPLDISGNIEGSLDPQLNGPVKGPFELIRKLANSELVEQVFVRHAFRFFMGRNETLADGPVLVAAHQAYKEKDGSMRALLTSLLTSDAFLYRRHVIDTAESSSP